MFHYTVIVIIVVPKKPYKVIVRGVSNQREGQVASIIVFSSQGGEKLEFIVHIQLDVHAFLFNVFRWSTYITLRYINLTLFIHFQHMYVYLCAHTLDHAF